MDPYYYNDLKEELEGLFLQEKREHLEEIQAEMTCELEELESNLANVNRMLAEVENEVNVGYKKELNMALGTVVAAYDGKYQLLPNNTLDIEGLQFRFTRYCWEESKLNVDIEGRKFIVQVRDFQKDFDALLKAILPEARPSEKKFVMVMKDGDEMSAVVKHVAEQLISAAEKIQEMAKEYGVG